MQVFGVPIQILVYIFAALFGAWALFHVWKLNARRAASVKFRAAIFKAFSGLYPLPIEWPDRSVAIEPRLKGVFSELQIAIAEFRPFIPWYRRRAFGRAWSRYRNAYGRDVDYQCYHHYMAFDDNPEYKEQFRNNVGKLLSFAKFH
ncbi:MAG: hypothetical protein WAK96_00745 [Desulfobaccales bacterium]